MTFRPLNEGAQARRTQECVGAGHECSARRGPVGLEPGNRRAAGVRAVDGRLQRVRRPVPQDAQDLRLVVEGTEGGDTNADFLMRTALDAQISSDKIYDAIRKDDADIGIVLEPAHRSELSPINRTRSAELEALAVESRALGLFVPRGHAMAELDAIPESLLNGLPIAVIGRVHGGPMASAITRYLEELGADPVRIPEGDFISMLRHAGRKHIAAIDTGWFDCFIKHDAFVQRPIEGQPLRTELLLVRSLREQRSASDHFWRRAEQAAAAAQGQEQRRRFLTPGSGYQPGNAKMFQPGN